MGYVVLAAAVVALGLLLTKVLVPIDAIQDAEQFVPRWMAENRHPWLTEVSAVASSIGDIPVLPGLVALTILVALVTKNFRVGAFLLTAILVEVTIYRRAALAVPRQRPDVVRLDILPVNESFPSGHVAASFVVYVGLAWLITSRFPRRHVAILCWTLVSALVLTVALSRVYRGMHHPLDILSGALVGAGSLLVALVAIRAYGQAKQLRIASQGPCSEGRALT
jgi:undecaprenyl-diphosphatase